MFALPAFTLSPAKTKKDCNNAVRFFFYQNYQEPGNPFTGGQFLIPSMFALPVFTLSPAENKNTRSKSARMFLFYTIYISNLEIHSQASQFLIPSMFALPVFTNGNTFSSLSILTRTK